MFKSNDEIYNDLLLLEQYAFRVPDEVLKLVTTIIGRRPQKPSFKYLKGFGRIEGKSHHDLLLKCIDVLYQIRFQKTSEVFTVLEKIYQVKEPGLRKNIIEKLERITTYNNFLINKIGFKPQKAIFTQIERWSIKKLIINQEILFKVCEELLKPSFESFSKTDYKTLTIHFGPLTITDELKQFREQVIVFIKKKLIKLPTNCQIKLLDVLQEASYTPHQGVYGDDVEEMVLENTKNIVKFYISIINRCNYKVIQEIEKQKNWFLKRYGEKQIPELSNLEELIATHQGYSIFRIFVGYDGQFNPDHNFEKDRIERMKKIDEFVADVSKSNITKWVNNITRITKNYSGSDPGSYEYFNIFLQKLGESKPELAYELFKRTETCLGTFSASIIGGIWKSNKAKIAEKKLKTWTTEAANLDYIPRIFLITGKIDQSILQGVFWKAKTKRDFRTLNSIIFLITQNYPKSVRLIPLMLETIKFLTRYKNTEWIDQVWFKRDEILKQINSRQYETILDNLLIHPDIDYRIEEVLTPVADSNPVRIIDFFRERVLIKSRRKDSILEDRYDAIPYEFHKLHITLAKHENKIIPKILQWYSLGNKDNHWLFQWEASELLSNIFPQQGPLLERELVKLSKTKSKKNRDIVFSILSKYKGSGSLLWNVVKTLVKTYFDDKLYSEVESELFAYLSQTGVVSGEFGFVNAYKSKKESLNELKRDADKRFAQFVRNYEKYLNHRIITEQKRAIQEIELRKRDID